MAPTTPDRFQRIIELHDALTSVDEVIALAARTTEVERMATLEVNSRRLLQTAWVALSRIATKAAVASVEKGAEEISGAIDATMARWATTVGPRFVANNRRIFQLARIAGKKRATGKIDDALVFDTTVPRSDGTVEKVSPETVRAMPIGDVVSDPQWQALRERLVGMWSEQPREGVRLLRAYLGEKPGPMKLRRVLNYLTGSGFRSGNIKHPAIDRLLRVVRARWDALFEVKKAVPVGAIIDFDTTDAEAIAALDGNNLFWIGTHYNATMRETIRATVSRVMLEEGQDRSRAAAALARELKKAFGEVVVPSGWHGTQKAYLEALAANSSTTARAQGQIRSFGKAGITHYEIVNPLDNRTCDVCAHMDGKVFKTDEGAQQADRVIKAKRPNEVRAIHPWIGEKAIKSLSPTAGRAPRSEVAKLTGAGQALPPYHYRCRCVVDVYDESEPL